MIVSKFCGLLRISELYLIQLLYRYHGLRTPRERVFFQKSQTFELGRGEQKIYFGKKITGITIGIMANFGIFWDFDFTRYSKNIQILQNIQKISEDTKRTMSTLMIGTTTIKGNNGIANNFPKIWTFELWKWKFDCHRTKSWKYTF